MKDLFSGSLGKLNNHGGSKIYTTPNTILVPPEYEIDIGEHGDFVSCSLDGRLWLFKKSRFFHHLVILRWNAENNKLVFVQTLSLREPTFLARGLDWILTDKQIFFAQDEEPYVFNYTLSEPLEFTSYNDNNYCLLPKINEDYQLINDYLFSRKENKYFKIEYFWPYGNSIAPFNQIALTQLNNQLYGVWGFVFAKCALVPSVLNINNEPVEYYLFFFTFHDKYNSSLMYYNTGIYSLLSSDRYVMIDKDYSSITCKNVKENLIIFLNENNDYTGLYFDENGNLSTDTDSYDKSGKLYLDVFTNKVFLIDKNYLSFRNNDKVFKANGLSQWINPNNNETFEGITGNAIIAKLGENDVLATYPNEEFHRELLRNKQISLTPYVFNGYRLSVGIIQNNKIGVNKLKSNEDNRMLNLEVKNLVNFEIVDYNFNSLNTLNSNVKHLNKGGQEGIYIRSSGNISGSTFLVWLYQPFVLYTDEPYGEPVEIFKDDNPSMGQRMEATEAITYEEWYEQIEDVYIDGSPIALALLGGYKYPYPSRHHSSISYYDSTSSSFINREFDYYQDYNYVDENSEDIEFGAMEKDFTVNSPDGITYNIKVPDYVDTDKIYDIDNNIEYGIGLIHTYGDNLPFNDKRRFVFYIDGLPNLMFDLDIPIEQCPITNNVCDVITDKYEDNSIIFIFDKKLAIRVTVDKNILKELTESETIQIQE